MTRRLAIDVGRHGVTANVIAPGVIGTDIRANSAEVLGDLVDVDRGVGTSSDKMDWLIPVGRPGPGRRGGRRRRCSWPATRPRTSPARCCTSTAGGTRRRCRSALPAGKRLAVSIGADFDAHCLWMGTFGLTSPSYLSRGEFGAEVGVPRLLAAVRRSTTCAPRGACPSHTLQTFPRQCRPDRRRRPRDRRPRLLPRAGAQARPGRGAAADGAADRRARAARRPPAARLPVAGVGLLGRHARAARGVRVRLGLVADGPRLRGLPAPSGRHRRP